MRGLFVGLVALFLSYSFLKFNGTPLFSIRVSPELVAKQGKLVSLSAHEDRQPTGAVALTCSEAGAPFLPAGAGFPPALR